MFFGSIPVLVALYMLKLNRRNKKVPSVHFIKKLISDNRGSSLFRRLSSNMLLLLEIIFLSLAVCALMNPGLPGQSILKKKIILLIDNSITMSSNESGGVRLDRAKSAARDVAASNLNSSFSIIEFSSSPRLITNSEYDRAEIDSKLSSIRPTHRKPNYKMAASLAEGLASGGEYPEIHIFSDFCSWKSDNVASFSGRIPVYYHKTGFSTRNIGVTALDISAAVEEGSPMTNIFFTVSNYCDYEVCIPCSVFVDGARSHSSIMTLAANVSESKVIKKYGSRPSNVSVEIKTSDSLAADDRRVINLSRRGPFKALVMSAHPYFYKAALESAGGVMVDTFEEGVPKSIYRNRSYDLVVIDDTAEALLYHKYKAGNFMVFAPPQSFLNMKFSGDAFDVSIKTPEFPYPYVMGADLSDIYIYKMNRAVFSGDFSQIVYGSSGVAVFMKSSFDGYNFFICMFDPRYSNFPLKVSFPVIFNNMVNIIGSSSVNADNFMIEKQNYLDVSSLAEKSKSLKGIVAYSSIEITPPDNFGAPELFSIDFSVKNGRGLYSLPEFRFAGLYKIYDEAAGQKQPSLYEFYVNPPEGRTLYIKPLDVKNARPASKANVMAAEDANYERSHVSYARAFILLALITLLLDWIYCNYRTFYKKEVRD